jgi:hypothetical protein
MQPAIQSVPHPKPVRVTGKCSCRPSCLRPQHICHEAPSIRTDRPLVERVVVVEQIGVLVSPQGEVPPPWRPPSPRRTLPPPKGTCSYEGTPLILPAKGRCPLYPREGLSWLTDSRGRTSVYETASPSSPDRIHSETPCFPLLARRGTEGEVAPNLAASNETL